MRWLVAIAATLALAVAACAPAPRARPLPTKSIDEGAGTTAAVRKQLEGSWTLLSMNVTAADGRQTDVDATGSLHFDGFGVLEIVYRVSDTGTKALAGIGVKSPNPVISAKGNVVIDPTAHRITYTADDFEKKLFAADPELAARRANPFALERQRQYSFDADGTLTLWTSHDNGRNASVTKWKRGV
jgi:hypothetical protein